MHRKSKQPIPRIALLQPPYKPDVAEVLQALGPPLDLFRLFARRPARARGILGWGRYYLSRDLALTLRDRELVILRTTALLGAQYEWGVHLTSYAGKGVLGHSQIRSVTRGRFDDPCWSDPRDRAVLRAVDELCRSHDLSDAAWHHDAPEQPVVSLRLQVAWSTGCGRRQALDARDVRSFAGHSVVLRWIWEPCGAVGSIWFRSWN